MATYAIGDIQGCYLTFLKLLEEINFDRHSDQLILLGDVINRGPNSLEALRFVVKHASSIQMVLGNHEIFAIALALDAIETNRSHTLHAMFNASDSDDLIDFLRSRPLIIARDLSIFLHAGILPSQSIHEALEKGKDISQILQSDKAKQFLTRFYEKTPTVDKPDLSHKKSLRLALAYLTFLRMCESKTTMDTSYSGTLEAAPKRLTPWFSLRDDGDYTIYFGHWAALGLYRSDNYVCLDTGCAWGNKLTALRIADGRVFQVDNCETDARGSSGHARG